MPEHRTETLKSTLNPEWNAQFRLQFSGTQDEISVQIWDWGKYVGESKCAHVGAACARERAGREQGLQGVRAIDGLRGSVGKTLEARRMGP